MADWQPSCFFINTHFIQNHLEIKMHTFVKLQHLTNNCFREVAHITTFFNNVLIHLFENSKWLPGGHHVFRPLSFRTILRPIPIPVSSFMNMYHKYFQSSTKNIKLQTDRMTDGRWTKRYIAKAHVVNKGELKRQQIQDSKFR